MDDVKAAIKAFQPHPDVADLPSCPQKPVQFFDDDKPDRPQHRELYLLPRFLLVLIQFLLSLFIVSKTDTLPFTNQFN